MQYQKKQFENQKEADIIEKQIIGVMSSHLMKNLALFLIQEVKEEMFLNSKNLALFSILKKGVQENENSIPEMTKNSLLSLWAEALEIAPYGEEQILKLPEKLKTIWFRYKTNEVLQRYADKNIQNAKEEIPKIWSELKDIQDGAETEKSDMSYIQTLFEKEAEIYEEKRQSGKALIGHETGFKDLDSAIEGLRDGHLWLVSGYTSNGKTFMVLNIIRKLMEQCIPVSMYSLEMSKVDIYKRMLGLVSGISGTYLLKGNLSDENKEKKNTAQEILKNSQMRVHTEKIDLDEMMTNMIIEYQTGRSKVFIIDYAQIIKAGGDSLYENMRRVAIELQSFCRKNNIPVILVSQISNESARNQSDVIGLKGAGDLAASADIVLELARSDEETKEEREQKMAEGREVRVKMVCKKNRHGRIFTSELWFQPKTGRFYNEDPELKNF